MKQFLKDERNILQDASQDATPLTNGMSVFNKWTHFFIDSRKVKKVFFGVKHIGKRMKEIKEPFTGKYSCYHIKRKFFIIYNHTIRLTELQF